MTAIATKVATGQQGEEWYLLNGESAGIQFSDAMYGTVAGAVLDADGNQLPPGPVADAVAAAVAS